MNLLVNAPNGEQMLFQVTETGSYFDPTRVLWDERSDGPLPSVTLGGMKRVGSNLVFDQEIMATTSAATLPGLKARLVENVDMRIAAIEEHWLRFKAEYVEREAAARAFAAASYQGSPGVWVTSFATNAGMANKAAADLIINKADGLRSALEKLGALRMTKYGIHAAGNAAAAQAKHDQILTQATAIASTL